LLNPFNGEAIFFEADVDAVELEVARVVVELAGAVDEEDELADFVMVNHSLQTVSPPSPAAPNPFCESKKSNSCPLSKLKPGLPPSPLRSTIHVYDEVPDIFSIKTNISTTVQSITGSVLRCFATYVSWGDQGE
jgi:hypothetical protein